MLSHSVYATIAGEYATEAALPVKSGSCSLSLLAFDSAVLSSR